MVRAALFGVFVFGLCALSGRICDDGGRARANARQPSAELVRITTLFVGSLQSFRGSLASASRHASYRGATPPTTALIIVHQHHQQVVVFLPRSSSSSLPLCGARTLDDDRVVSFRRIVSSTSVLHPPRRERCTPADPTIAPNRSVPRNTQIVRVSR